MGSMRYTSVRYNSTIQFTRYLVFTSIVNSHIHFFCPAFFYQGQKLGTSYRLVYVIELIIAVDSKQIFLIVLNLKVIRTKRRCEQRIYFSNRDFTKRVLNFKMKWKDN